MNPGQKMWLMLVSRSIMFLGFQALFALAFKFGGSADAWKQSEAWWTIAVILTDLICLVLLVRFYRQEELNFWEVFRIQRQYIKKDAVFLLGFLLIAGPVGYLPNIISARLLFGNPQTALDLLIRPLPAWAALISFVLFPLLQGLVEIPTYMLYALPRLEEQGVRPWFAVALAAFFLSFQHVFTPFIPDVRFIAYRLVMFLPFAVLVAIVMRNRPHFMPYMAVIHLLMDLSVAVMFLPIIS